ncbi:MAG: hypothetical protein JXA23_00015, partial [Bacteroidales bacterium]|nr:hypothetical protein [Bacteroidales bacterium]
MKPLIFICFFFFLASSEVLWAQIVIDQSDMPKAGDTLRVSLTTSIPGNYSQTGNGITWDFSMLQPMNQRVDTFVDASVTPQEYWVYFIPGLISNLASPKGNSEFFPGVPVSQTYIFYKNSIEAFVDNGFAFKIQGYAFPVRYDIPDKYYVFPLDTNATWASTSDFAFQFPGLFFFSTHRVRSSFVDGWGTVITPFGSFQSLRIRSDLVQHDSIFIDSLGFGIGLTRNVTEYKWLAENRGIPVLQINTEGLLTTATYLDSARLPSTPLSLTLGPDTTVNKGDTITLHATVSGGAPPYRFFWSTLDTSQSLTVTMDTTRSFEVVVIDGLNQFASDQKVVTVISPGIDEPEVLLLRIFPNPSTGRIHLSMPGDTEQGTLSIFNSFGKEILKKEMKA